MVGELQVVLGVGARPAGRLLDLAHRLTTVLPDTLDALAAGRLDLTRARALAEATEVLSTANARLVQDRLLGVAGSARGRAVAAVLAGPDRAHRDPGRRGRRGAAPEGATRRAVGALGADRGRDGRTDRGHRRRRCGDDRTGPHRPGAGPGRPHRGRRVRHDGPAPGRRVRRGVPPDPGRASATRGPGAPGTRARAGGPRGHLLRHRPGRQGPR